MKSPLAAVAGLLVLLARAPGSTVEAVLRARSVAAGCRWENFAAASAFKPVLAKFFGHLGVHFLLALLACYSGRWQCHHGGLKMFDALVVWHPQHCRRLMAWQQDRHFSLSFCLSCARGKASSILLLLHMPHEILLASSFSLRVFGPVSPCLHCMHMRACLNEHAPIAPGPSRQGS